MEKQNKKRTIRALIILSVIAVIVTAVFVFWGITPKNIKFYLPRRLKKVAAVIITGFCIGYSAVSFQTITNNKILTPSIIGLDQLYLFIQTLIVFFLGSAGLDKLSGLPNYMISIAVMILCSWLLFLTLFKGRQKNLYFMILAGTILGGLFGGLATFMQVLLDPNEFTVLQGKMFASFNNINTDLLGISIVIVIIISLATIKDYRYLDVIALGTDHAINLGVPYQRVVLTTLMALSILTAVTTALVGPVTFLGILVVSISRTMIQSYEHKYRIFAATMLGIISLITSMLFVERVLHFATQISVIINLIGGMYFIYLILKENRK